MNTSRHTEVNVLGYRIDHVRVQGHAAGTGATEAPQAGGLDDWREVLSPDGGGVLARFSSREEAERYIIDRELASSRRVAQPSLQPTAAY